MHFCVLVADTFLWDRSCLQYLLSPQKTQAQKQQFAEELELSAAWMMRAAWVCHEKADEVHPGKARARRHADLCIRRFVENLAMNALRRGDLQSYTEQKCSEVY